MRSSRRVLRRARARRRGADRHRRLLAERRRQPRPAPRAVLDQSGRATGIKSFPRRSTTRAGASCCSSCTPAATASTSASSRPRPSSRRSTRNTPREMSAAEIEADDRRFRERGGAGARGRLRRRRDHGLRGLPDHAVPRRAHQSSQRRVGRHASPTACASPPRSCAARAPRRASDFIIVYRISALDLVEGGLECGRKRSRWRARSKPPARRFSIPASAGTRRACRPSRRRVPRGGFAWATRRLKEAVRIPVVASNRINAPEIAEEILARGDADMVSLAARHPRRRRVRQQGVRRRPRRHQHLHRLQPGLPRPLLHRPAGELRRQSEGRKRNQAEV